jgi:Icc protein
MNKSINLLQITDCHLQESEQQSYKGFYPDQRLDAVIQSVHSQFKTPSHFDSLILSGDLAHYSQASVYQRLLDKTQLLAGTRLWLPGNHDDVAVMAAFQSMQTKVSLHQNWAIVLLDSTSNPNGIGSGELSDKELIFLENIEATIESKAGDTVIEHIFIVLHHPPIDVNSQWQDEIKLANSDAFWKILKKLSTVRAISFGHLHQEHHLKRANIELFCTPASAPQFKKFQSIPVLEDDEQLSMPGFRTFSLFEDGTIDSNVYRSA